MKYDFVKTIVDDLCLWKYYSGCFQKKCSENTKLIIYFYNNEVEFYIRDMQDGGQFDTKIPLEKREKRRILKECKRIQSGYYENATQKGRARVYKLLGKNDGTL